MFLRKIFKTSLIFAGQTPCLSYLSPQSGGNTTKFFFSVSLAAAKKYARVFVIEKIFYYRLIFSNKAGVILCHSYTTFFYITNYGDK